MYELIGLSDLSLNLLFTLLFLGLVTQCLLFYFVLTDAKKRKSVIVFQALLLCWLIWLCWFIGTLKDNLYIGFALMPGADMRPGLIGPIALGLWLSVRTRRIHYGLSAIALLAVIPVFDGFPAGTFGLRLTASCALLCLFNVLELSERVAAFRQSITGLSVKEALDQLPDGLLFAGQSGWPVSVNRSAQVTLENLGLSSCDRVSVIWDALSKHPDRLQDTDDPDGLLIRTGDGCLSFRKYALKVGRRRFTQLYLRDVTREFYVSAQIIEENHHLEKNAGELKRLLELAEDNARKREILDSRARFHDILSQRLTLTQVLLGALESSPDPGQIAEIKGLLSSIGRDLFDEINLSSQARFEQLIRIFKTIGIEILCQGRLPDADEVSDVFVKILREAFSNALRHAGASRIIVRFKEDISYYRMSVLNDGYCPSAAPKEGNGIQSMRSRLESFCGSLSVETEHEFTLSVCVPK